MTIHNFLRNWGIILNNHSNPQKQINLYLLIAFFLTILFVRCIGPLSLSRPLPDVDPETLIHSVEQHALKLKTLHSKANVQVGTKYGVFSGTLEMKAIMPDSIWMKIEGPMGIDIGVLQMGGENVLFYSPYQNIAYQGNIDEMGKIQPMPISVDTKAMIYGLTGLIRPQSLQNDSLGNCFISQQKYVCNYNNGDRYWIQNKGPVVSKWEHSEQDTLLWSWEGDEFRKKSGVQLPRIIRLKQQQSGEKMTFSYYYTEVNKSFEKSWCAVNLPEGVMRIEF